MEKVVTVFAGHESEGEWPGKAVEFIAWLQDHVDTVPEIYRDKVDIEVNLVGLVDPDDVELCIWYLRPLTDDEAKDRELQDARRKTAHEAYERNMLLTLLEKYGNGE